MLLLWVLLCIAAIGGAIALVFHLTVELNELEKVMTDLSQKLSKKYGKNDEK